MGIKQWLKSTFSPNVENKDTTKEKIVFPDWAIKKAHEKLERGMDIKALTWNEIIKKYPNKFPYLENKSTVDETNKRVTFKGEFNISGKKEEHTIVINLNGEKIPYTIILIKKYYKNKNKIKINKK